MKSSNKSDSSRIMREEKIPKLLVLYSLPVFFSYICNSIDNLVCRAFIGKSVGSLGLAAIGIVFPFTLVQLSFAFLLGMGGSTLAASRVGEGRTEEANRAMNQSMQLLVVVGAVILVIANLFMDPLLVLFGASDAVLPYAREYGRILISGCMFQLISVGMTNYMRVEGKTALAMFAVILGPIVNFVLNVVLVKILDWGLTGAALATVTGHFCNTCVVVIHYIINKGMFRFNKDLFKVKFSLVGNIIYLGLSAFALQICQGLVSILLNRVAKRVGSDAAISAMSVVTTLQTFITTIVSATNMGSQSLIAYNYGAKLYGRIRELIKKAIAATVVIVLIEYVILAVFNKQIAGLFSGDADVVNIAARAMLIYLIATPLVPFQIQGAGFFQAIKKPIISMVLSLSRQAIVLAPMLLILPKRFGMDGIYFAGPIADTVSVLVTVPLLVSYLKKMRGMEGNELAQ